MGEVTAKKRCSSCGNVKPLEQFHKNNRRADGRTTYCAACKVEYNSAYYQRTKERHNPGRVERRRRQREENTRRLIEYLLEHPCVDCGETDILVLQFDHQGDKEANICDLVRDSAPWGRVERESAKCGVVCANDHQRRTARTGGWRKLLTRGAGFESPTAYVDRHALVAQKDRAADS